MATSRRVVGSLMSVLIVVVGFIFVGTWISHHFHSSRRAAVAPNVRVERAEPTTLGPGDVRIYNVDTTVDLMLAGNSIFAGLSPKMVDKIKAGLDSSAAGDSTGLGSSISRIVKQSIGGAIGTHAVFPSRTFATSGTATARSFSTGRAAAITTCSPRPR